MPNHEFWEKYSRKIQERDASESAQERANAYLKEYALFCGYEVPNRFFAAEYLYRSINHGEGTRSAYRQRKVALSSVMGGDGFFDDLHVSYIKNTYDPPPKKIYDALANKSINKAVVILSILSMFIKMSRPEKLETKLRHYDRQKGKFFGRHVIPEPYRFIVDEIYDRIVERGGNQDSYFCHYSTYDGEIDFSRKINLQMLKRRINKAFAITGVDLFRIINLSEVPMLGHGVTICYFPKWGKGQL